MSLFQTTKPKTEPKVYSQSIEEASAIVELLKGKGRCQLSREDRDALAEKWQKQIDSKTKTEDSSTDDKE